MPLTKNAVHRTLPSIILLINSDHSFVTEAMNISLRRKGATRTVAKGHPRMPPKPKNMIADGVLLPPLQSMKSAAPSIQAYMEKLEGR